MLLLLIFLGLTLLFPIAWLTIVILVNKLILNSQEKKRINTHIYHFQVNNHLVWSTSKHDVYFPSGLQINHWSGIHSSSNLTTNVLDLSKPVKPTEVIHIILYGYCFDCMLSFEFNKLNFVSGPSYKS